MGETIKIVKGLIVSPPPPNCEHIMCTSLKHSSQSTPGKGKFKTDSLFRFSNAFGIYIIRLIIVVTGKGRHSSPAGGGDDSKTGSATSMRRTSEKDKFGFYHSSAQPSNSSNSASSQKEDGKQDKSVTNTTVDSRLRMWKLDSVDEKVVTSLSSLNQAFFQQIFGKPRFWLCRNLEFLPDF